MITTETQKEINQTIINLCKLIQAKTKSNSATDQEQLPSLVKSLAELIAN
jgi:hypothetical protein